MTHAEGQRGQDDSLPAERIPDPLADQAGSTRMPAGNPPAGTGLTTAQIAQATPQATSAQDTAQQPSAHDHPQQQAAAASQARGGSAYGSGGGQQQRAQLLAPDEMQGIIDRWKEIQAGFVDEPRKAVKDADSLVADLMQRLARMFAAEREQLETRWMAGDSVSTEDLRQGLQRYRSFFERLLAA